MADRERVIKRAKERTTSDGKRRITKDDGKFAVAANIKSSANVVLPEVRKVLLDRRKKDSGHRTSIIYPSEMARADWCPRATYYRMSGLPNPPSVTSFTLENVFAEGNAIHSKWQNWLSETGLLWGDWRCSRCSEYVRNSLKPEDRSFGDCVGTKWVDLNKHILGEAERPFPHDWKYKEVTLSSTSHKISGHADGALIKHNCMIEIKSLGVGTLRFEAPKLLEAHTHKLSGKNIVDIDGMWKDLHRPLLAHVKQGNIYLWMAKEMNLPFDTMVFLYEFKANQQVKEFSVKLSPDILNPMLDVAAQIEYALTVGVPPSCPKGGCAQCRAYEQEEENG